MGGGSTPGEEVQVLGGGAEPTDADTSAQAPSNPSAARGKTAGHGPCPTDWAVVKTVVTVAQTFMNDQQGALFDWKANSNASRRLGNQYVLTSNSRPHLILLPDIQVHVSKTLPHAGRKDQVIQEPLKSGSIVQLPGGILTRVLCLALDVYALNINKHLAPIVKVVLAWPSGAMEGAVDEKLGPGTKDSLGTPSAKSMLEVADGFGLLISVSARPSP